MRITDLFFRKKKISNQSEQVFDVIKPGDICIDCGANIGLVTLKMLKKGAYVYAFEPNTHAYEQLKENIAPLSSDCMAYQKGVWHRNSTLKLFLHQNSDQDQVKWSTGSSLVDSKSNIAKDKHIEVEVIRLSEFISSLNSMIKIVKIDIEGAEYDVLEDLILSGAYKKIEQIFVETHAHKIPELLPKHEMIKKLIKSKKIKNINLDWI